MINKIVMLFIAVCMVGSLVYEAKAEENAPKSADEVAKELANPAGSLASLSFNFQYTEFEGDLPDSRDQDSLSMIFQPVLPFPVGDKGRRLIFRPAFTFAYKQPFFDGAKLDFDNQYSNLADTTFDLVYAGTTMKTQHCGFLWGTGIAGTLPTATDDDLAGDQWRLGPEFFGGILRKWGIVGALVSHQWNVAGSNDTYHSSSAAQYFYAIGLGKGWQIASSPLITYDWEADSGEAWTVPIGVGLAKTTKIGKMPWKFQLQLQKFVAQPDTFGPDWLIKFTITPVIKNPFIF